MKPNCSRPDCSKPAQTRGLCGAHYKAQLRADRAAGITKPPAKEPQLTLRFSEAELKVLTAAAKRLGLKTATAIRSLALAGAGAEGLSKAERFDLAKQKLGEAETLLAGLGWELVANLYPAGMAPARPPED